MPRGRIEAPEKRTRPGRRAAEFPILSGPRGEIQRDRLRVVVTERDETPRDAVPQLQPAAPHWQALDALTVLRVVVVMLRLLWAASHVQQTPKMIDAM